MRYINWRWHRHRRVLPNTADRHMAFLLTKLLDAKKTSPSIALSRLMETTAWRDRSLDRPCEDRGRPVTKNGAKMFVVGLRDYCTGSMPVSLACVNSWWWWVVMMMMMMIVNLSCEASWLQNTTLSKPNGQSSKIAPRHYLSCAPTIAGQTGIALDGSVRVCLSVCPRRKWKKHTENDVTGCEVCASMNPTSGDFDKYDLDLLSWRQLMTAENYQ